MESNTLIAVTNRSDFYVGYPIPDGVGERDFAPGETKKITFEELQKLSFSGNGGGMALLKEYFIIQDEEALDLILGNVEPEYYYTDEEVKELLLNGTYEQLLDTLDFGTAGVIELIKKYIVDLEIPDLRKRDAVQQKTGLDVNKAILIKKEYEEDNEPEQEKVRRAAPIEKKESAPVRRAATPVAQPSTPASNTSSKYRVVSK